MNKLQNLKRRCRLSLYVCFIIYHVVTHTTCNRYILKKTFFFVCNAWNVCLWFVRLGVWLAGIFLLTLIWHYMRISNHRKFHSFSTSLFRLAMNKSPKLYIFGPLWREWIYRGPMYSPHKRLIMQKVLPCWDIMMSFSPPQHSPITVLRWQTWHRINSINHRSRLNNGSH